MVIRQPDAEKAERYIRSNIEDVQKNAQKFKLLKAIHCPLCQESHTIDLQTEPFLLITDSWTFAGYYHTYLCDRTGEGFSTAQTETLSFASLAKVPGSEKTALEDPAFLGEFGALLDTVIATHCQDFYDWTRQIIPDGLTTKELYDRFPHATFLSKLKERTQSNQNI